MGFNDFSSSVKLNNIKTYSGVNTTNNSFKNTFYSDIKDIDYSQYEEIDYNAIDLEEGIETEKNEKEWYEVAGAYIGTFSFSVLEGFIDLGEGVIDAHIYGIAKTLQVFGVDDKWAEDIISYDVSGEMYDWMIEGTGIDKDIAYGKAHSAGNFVGEMAGYYALSCVPFVGTALCAIGGAGSAVEDSMISQLETNGEINDWKVFGSSILGSIEGFGFGKAASGLKAGVKVMSKVGVKNTLKQTVGSITKGSVKNTLKQSGKIATKAGYHTLIDSDTWIETGSVLADDVFNGIETGQWDWKKMVGETAVVIGENYLGNLAGGLIGDVIGNSTKNSQVEITEKIFDETTAKLDEITEKLIDETTAKLDEVTEKLIDETTSKLDEVTEKLSETIQRSPRQIAALDSFSKVMQTGSPSDERLVKLLYKTFDESISNGNYESLLLLEKFVGLKSQNPGLTIEIDTGNNSYWQKSFSKIVIGKDHLDWMDSSTISHELGHCLFDSVLDGKVPENWDSIVSKAKVVSSTDDAIVGLGDQLIKKSNDTYWKARGEFIQGLQNNKGLTFSEYTDQLTEMYNNLLNKGESQSLINFCKSEGYPEYVINNLELGSITGEELAIATTNFEIYKVKEGIERTQNPGLGAVSDIMDAVYEGQNTDLNGNSFSVTYQHGKEYYLNDGEYYQFHEVIAEFTSLKIAGDQASLNLLKNLFGDEFYNCLEETYIKFIS